jgi:hypothetical protein
MNNIQRYRFVCTLSFGDIYGQIIVWLIVLFVSLAAAMGLMGASRPIYALATVGLILVLSLPFIEFAAVDPAEQAKPANLSASSGSTSQRPAQAAG